MLDILKKEILPNAEEYCKSNWNEIFNAMQEVFEKHNTSRHEGILQLEEGLDEVRPTYFKDLLRAVVDGHEKEYVEDIAVNMFYFRRLSGLEAYLFLIRSLGVLAIKDGVCQDFLIRLFWSLVPEKREGEVFVQSEEQFIEKMKKLLSAGEPYKAIDFVHTEDKFSEIFCGLSDEEVWKVLRESDTMELAAAAKYSTKEVINKMMNSMSMRAICIFTEDANYFCGKKEESDKAKGQIFGVINRVTKCGEVEN